jgi:hypothetical protein
MSDKTLSILPGCDDHEHATWLIGPVGHHRDSDTVEEANWQCVTERFAELDPEQSTWEIHRFGHWAVGWVEEIAYVPGSAVARAAAEFRRRLDNYPVLDEMRLEWLESELEGDTDEWDRAS